MALLDEMNNQQPTPEEEVMAEDPSMMGEEDDMGETMSDDMDALIGGAFESNEFNDVGIGVEMASEEEHQLLGSIMDGIEDVIHGSQAERVVQLMRSTDSPFEGIGMAAHAISLSAYMEASKQGAPVTPDIFLAENGVVQETVELLWEVADAINIVDIDDDEQLTASYLNTVRLLGESMLEMDNPQPVASAQEFLIELELGYEVNGEDYLMEEEMPPDPSQVDPMQQAMASQEGMPPQDPMMEQQMQGGQAPMPPMPQNY